jgi:hypothetical protein
VDRTGLADIAKAIGGKDANKFAAAYRQTLEGCDSCHQAADKAYLRPRIPDQPEARIINTNHVATWP